MTFRRLGLHSNWTKKRPVMLQGLLMPYTSEFSSIYVQLQVKSIINI